MYSGVSWVDRYDISTQSTYRPRFSGFGCQDRLGSRAYVAAAFGNRCGWRCFLGAPTQRFRRVIWVNCAAAIAIGGRCKFRVLPVTLLQPPVTRYPSRAQLSHCRQKRLCVIRDCDSGSNNQPNIGRPIGLFLRSIPGITSAPVIVQNCLESSAAACRRIYCACWRSAPAN